MGSGRLSYSTGQSTQMPIQVQKILSSSVQHFSTSVGSRKCHPDFFPLSVFCPCLVLGRTQSILDNESGADCYSSLFQLGPTGCCLCMFGSIANCCFPLAVSPLFGCCSMCQRARIMEQFNIEGGALELFKACFCPCGVFQQNRFMKDVQRRKLESYSRSSRRSLIANQQGSGCGDPTKS
jgi:hypothetical protein